MTSPELRVVHGRGMNNLSDAYKLPVDHPEMERLALQHKVVTLCFDGLYPQYLNAKVDHILRIESGVKRAVLDIGCGSGSWTIAIAQKFPDAEVIGLDLAKNHHLSPRSNCKFLQGDISLGLPQYSETFDLVHARTVVVHLKDPVSLVQIVAESMKPGGMFMIIEPQPHDGLTNMKRQPLEPALPDSPFINEFDNEKHSWFYGWFVFLGKLATGRTPGEQTLEQLLEGNKLFTCVQASRHAVPMGWAGEDIEHGDELGQLWAQAVMDGAQACLPAILASNVYSEDDVRKWLENVETEIRTGRRYSIWTVATAIKC